MYYFIKGFFMSKILVTGGLGFIGSHFVNYIMEKGIHDVILVDNMTYASNIDNVKILPKFLKKNIKDLTLEDLEDCDYIVNFAAETHVDNSIKDGLPFLESNIIGVYNLVEIAKKNKNLKKFIQISTDEVYGDLYDRLILNPSAFETANLNPSSYYSASKASAEMIVMAASRTFGLPYLITRTCNNYGENQNKEKFLPTVINSIKNDLEIPVYGDGSQIREWIHVIDNVNAIYNLMMSNDVNETYNIGSGERYSNLGVIKIIGEILNKDIKYKFVEDRLGHDKRYSIHSMKYENKFGKIPTIKLKEWLKQILEKF